MPPPAVDPIPRKIHGACRPAIGSKALVSASRLSMAKTTCRSHLGNLFTETSALKITNWHHPLEDRPSARVDIAFLAEGRHLLAAAIATMFATARTTLLIIEPRLTARS
jgi:hypothetical protein